MTKALEYLLYPSAGRCPYCGDENGNGLPCAKCEDEMKSLLLKRIDSARVSKYAHSGIARDMVLRLKFEGRKNLASHIAKELAPLVPAGTDIITFVPLHPARERKRGYNQARLIAERLSEITDIPCENLLVRVKNTHAQSKTGSAHERRENLKDAFRPAVEQAAVRGKRILIIDDVITTGTTVSECEKPLLQMNAAAVSALSFTASVVTDQSYEKN